MATGWYPGAEVIPGVVSYSPGGEPKVGFCDHAAGGFYNTLRRASFWNSAGYSVHFGVSRLGQVCQLVNIFDRAWGQGRLGPIITWLPYNTMDRRNPNEYLISIEHEDWVVENGVAHGVPGSQWTEEEYQATLALKQWCIEQITSVSRFARNSLASHHMFDGVNRVNCAGSYWRNEYHDRQWLDLSGGPEDMFTIWSKEVVEIPNLVQGVNAPSLRQLFGLPLEHNDWDFEFSTVGDAVVYHGIPTADNRRAGRIRGDDQLVRVRLSNNTGACYVQCLTGATRVWVAPRGYHTPQAVW